MLAMTNQPRFTGYRFIEISRKSHKALRERRDRYCQDVDFDSVRGDCNDCLGEVLRTIPQRDPLFVVMDPQGLELRWNDVVVPAASAEHSELLINFPYYMGIRRCLSPNQNEATSRSVTEYFGSDAWMEWRDKNLEREISEEELRDALLKIYVDGLKGLGLPHVQVSPIVTGDKNHPLYYLIFASRKDVGKRIIADIMKIDKTSQTTLPLS
jgi:three-Cys-motif partner protein